MACCNSSVTFVLSGGLHVSVVLDFGPMQSRLDQSTKTLIPRTALPFALAAALAVALQADAGQHGGPPMEEAPAPALSTMPRTVGSWTHAGAPRRIEAETIFDYMNGAGELYVAYRFAHLDVHTYRAEGQPDIVAEVYQMDTADDAWGLQSEDWTGDAIALGAITAESRLALYGAGLLRLACASRYARVMAYEETEASRAAVLELGFSIAAECRDGAPPAVAAALPPSVGRDEPRIELRADRVRFLRSHLVLNNVYYLASEDLLGLGHDVDAVYAEYRPPDGDHTTRYHALSIRYDAPERAEAALGSFNRAYLEMEDGDGFCRQVKRLEGGWLAFGREGSSLAFVFDGPQEEMARALMEALLPGTDEKGSTR